MSIEPSDVRFQVGSRVLPHEAKSIDQYRDKLIAKYGRVPGPQELADLEEAAQSRRARAYASIPSKKPIIQKPATPPVGKRQLHNSKLAGWHDDRAFAAIPENGATTKEIAAIVGRSPEGVRNSLVRMKRAGRIRSDNAKGHTPVRWFKA